MIRAAAFLLVSALTAACSSAPSEPQQPPAAPPVQPATAPKIIALAGAKIEPSGYLTIEQARPSPVPPPEPRQPSSELTFYAELAGVSNEEAAKRLRAQEALRPEMERLLAQLRGKERGNFTEAELIHRPDWAFLLFFKRDPERTLAKYTRNPRFQARQARYTLEELNSLSRPWVERFNRERLLTGYGFNARQGLVEMDMVVSEAEYAAIASRNGWSPAPDFLQLKFDRAPAGPPVEPSVAHAVRIFPQSDRSLGITHQAAFHGRILLRDGCLSVVGHDGKTSLAYFPREVGLYRDPQGYLALRTRGETARHLGRIGEEFMWAGPISLAEDAPMVKELRARCGDAPLMHVAIPESLAIVHARYPHLRNPVPPPPPPVER